MGRRMDYWRSTDYLHAMVLIGGYCVGSRYWFVLQNTHQNHYFKIVDSVHLASIGATVQFAREQTDMSLKGNYDVTEGAYVETSFDIEECMPNPPEDADFFE